MKFDQSMTFDLHFSAVKVIDEDEELSSHVT